MYQDSIFVEIESHLKSEGFAIERKDLNRPWGGFWVIDEKNAAQFIDSYFPMLKAKEIINSQKISPKILLVKPGKRLSWQYHFRRKEVWKVVKGKVGVIRSLSDEETPMKIYDKDDLLTLELQERHRLIGLKNYGIIAEIWLHTDPLYPSDENDIIRLQDDFKRSSPVN